ncbi:MAG: helix-turn-helix domain-containing protein [Thermoleophilia bacterium]
MQMHDEVRSRLRAIRRSRGLTLAEVAERAGMAVSTLSRLETGTRRIALDHIPPLAAALGVSADDLLGAKPPDPRVRHQPPHEHDGITFWPLTASTPPGAPRAFKMRISASRTPDPNPRTHEGHEWLYVLSGRVRLILGDAEVEAGPGEALEFSTLTPHWIGAIGGDAEAIGIFGPHGERVHMHETP